MKEYYLRITSLCNLDCIFCETRIGNISFDINKYLNLIYVLKKKKYTRLIITWWEPTIYINQIIILVKYAKKLWFSLSLHTNALSSYDINIAMAITNIWFDEIMVSFHSHIESDFEYIYNKKWVYSKVLNWLNNLINLWNDIYLNIVANKVNYKYLENILDFINKEFSWIKIVTLSFINPIKEDDKNSLLLNKTILYNSVYEILSMSNITNKYSFKLHSDFFWIPYCIYNKDHLLKVHFEENKYNNDYLYNDFKKIKYCEWCFYYNQCKWINEKYINIFWDSEFKSVIFN